MIFDCHTHITDNNGSYNVEFPDHTSQLAGVIVLARKGEDNRKIADMAAKISTAVTFGFTDPSAEKKPAEAVEKIHAKSGCKGLVVYCGETAMHPCHSKAMQAYAAAEKLGMPVFFHNECVGSDSVLDYTQPVYLDEIARTFPSLKMIIGSMGRPYMTQTIEVVARHKNVYACLQIRPERSWELYNTIISVYEANVMDKVLYGSGYPENSATKAIETLLGLKLAFSDTGLPWVGRSELRKIIERNSFEVLGLSPADKEG